MESQKDLIHLKDWDCLVILDACRYDFFQNNYRDFFNGSLRKVDSNAVHTGEWLKNTFDNYDPNIAYISATPCVNSLGVSLEETNPYWGIDWTATEHFSKIIDVWNFGWSERLETVPPEAVTETSLMVQGKKVIHYMQPHIPYLDLKENSADNISSQDGIVRDRTKGEGINVLEILGREIAELIGTEPLWRLKRELGLPPTDTMESAWRRETSADVYSNNLLRALKSARRLVESADEKIIVTADHGECLGEQNCWGHGPGRVRSPLIEVPWLEVK